MESDDAELVERAQAGDVEAYGKLVRRYERRVAAETVEVTPGLHEDVLRRLLDVTLVVEQPCQHEGDATLVATHELAVRLDVAGLCALDELGVVRLHCAIVGRRNRFGP